MPKNTKARIPVVEAEAAILQGLLDVFVLNGYDAAGVADGAEGLKKALTEKFDLIILDVMLPGKDGFSVCKAVREKKPDQGIVMLTAKGSENDVVTGFKASADEDNSKPFSLRELLVRVEAVLRRSGKCMGDDEIRHNGMLFDGKTLTASRGDQSIELTRKEMDIIQYLFRHRERIVSKKELLVEVWNYADANIETRTVDIHMLKLRKKIMTLNDEAPFIQTIRGEGYRLEPGK